VAIYFNRHKDDRENPLIQKLIKLQEMSEERSFSLLLANILLYALAKVSVPSQTQAPNNLDFFLYCAQHKDFFLENLGVSPISLALETIEPDRTLNPTRMTLLQVFFSAMDDSPWNVNFAFSMVFALASCDAPDPDLMTVLVKKAMSEFESSADSDAWFIQTLKRHQRPENFNKIMETLIKALKEYQADEYNNFYLKTSESFLRRLKKNYKRNKTPVERSL
jgi:hypothetical protein